MRFKIPSRISINPTANSIDRPTRAGIATLKRIIAAPTSRTSAAVAPAVRSIRPKDLSLRDPLIVALTAMASVFTLFHMGLLHTIGVLGLLLVGSGGLSR